MTTLATSNLHFTSQLHPTARVSDLDHQTVLDYLGFTLDQYEPVGEEQKAEVQRLQALDKLDLYKELGLIVADPTKPEEYKVKNFALLLFALKPEMFFISAFIRILREHPTSDRVQVETYTGPLWVQAKKVVNYFRNSVYSTYVVHKADSPEPQLIRNYTERAFKEILANAIIHRDYETDLAPIEICIDDYAISISNPNLPLDPFIPEYLHAVVNENGRNGYPPPRNDIPRVRRNPEIAEFFAGLRYFVRSNAATDNNAVGLSEVAVSLAENGSPELEVHKVVDYLHSSVGSMLVIMASHPEFTKDY